MSDVLAGHCDINYSETYAVSSNSSNIRGYVIALKVNSTYTAQTINDVII